MGHSVVATLFSQLAQCMYIIS